jgi:hypothetical protein
MHAVGTRIGRRQREDTGQLVAVLGGEPAGIQRGGAERLDVDDREGAAHVLHMEWLDQLEAVQ